MPRYVIDLACQFVSSVSVSQDGLLLATADSTPAVRIWNLATGKETHSLALPNLETSSDWFNWIRFIRDSLQLLVTDTNGRMWLCDLFASKYKQLASELNGVAIAAVAPSGQVIAVATLYSSVLLWDLSQDRLLRVLEHEDGTSEHISCLRFTESGHTIARSKIRDNSIAVYEIGDSPRWRSLSGHEDTVLAIDYSSNGRFLASGARDNTVRLWDLTHDRETGLLHGEGNIVRDVAFSPNGSVLAVANGYRSFSAENPASSVSLFRVSDLSKVGDFIGHTDSVNCISFSSDGRTLVSGGNDGRVIVWDTEPINSGTRP